MLLLRLVQRDYYGGAVAWSSVGNSTPCDESSSPHFKFQMPHLAVSTKRTGLALAARWVFR